MYLGGLVLMQDDFYLLQFWCGFPYFIIEMIKIMGILLASFCVFN